jgi:hypothetical protein
MIRKTHLYGGWELEKLVEDARDMELPWRNPDLTPEENEKVARLVGETLRELNLKPIARR